MRSILILMFLSTAFSISAQEQALSFWSDAMINSNHPENRILAFDKFYDGFKSEMEKPDAFNFDFESIPELTILADTANTFKLITWQVEKEKNFFEYYGFIVKKEGQVYELKDDFANMEDLEYLELNADEWLGGIYYSMVEMGGNYYVFSYRQNNEFEKFKSFDYLSFAKDGAPILGKEVFKIERADLRDIIKTRIVFHYSADAVLSLGFNKDLRMVVHDHLMQVNGQLPNQGLTKVPDGTYEGYKFSEGKWVYEEKLFNHTYDEAPRPERVLGKSTRDIFGKDKKNK